MSTPAETPTTPAAPPEAVPGALPGPSEPDATGTYLGAFQRDAGIERRGRLLQMRAQLEAEQKTPAAAAKPPAAEQPVGGPGGEQLSDFSAAGAVARDVAQGALEAVPQLVLGATVGAISDAIRATDDLVTFGASMLGAGATTPATLEQRAAAQKTSEASQAMGGPAAQGDQAVDFTNLAQRFADQIDVAQPESVTGGFFRATGNFLSFFIPIAGQIRATTTAARLAAAAPRLARGAEAVVAGIPAAFLEADASDAAFEEWKAQAPENVQATLDEFLTNEDPKAEKRLGKRLEAALVGTLFGGVAEGAFAAAKFFRAKNIVRRAMAKAEAEQALAASKAKPGVVQPAAPKDLNDIAFGPAEQPAFTVTEPTAAPAAVPEGQTPLAPPPDVVAEKLAASEARVREIFGDQVTPDELQRLAKLDTQELDLSGTLRHINTSDDAKQVIVDVTKALRGDVDLARRGDAGRHGVMSDATVLRMAEESGFDATALLERHRGQPLAPEDVLVSKKIMGAAANMVMDVKARLLADPSDANSLGFLKSLSVFKALNEEFLGARAEAGRAVRAYGIDVTPGDIQAKQVRMLLETQGGQRKAVEMAAALQKLEASGVTPGGIKKAIDAAAQGKLYEEIIANGYLWRPRTHVANTAGSLMFILRQIGERKSAEIGVDALGDIRAEEGIALGEAAIMNSAFWGAVRQSFSLTLRANRMAIGFAGGKLAAARNPGATLARGGELLGELAEKRGIPPALTGSGSSRAETAGEVRDLWSTRYKFQPDDNIGLTLDYLSAANRIPSTLLQQEDLFSKMIAYDVELNAQAWRKAWHEGGSEETIATRYRELMATPTEEIRFEATSAAQLSTLTNRNAVASQIIKLRDHSDRAIFHMPLYTLLTFVRTPLNALARDIERTPIGLLGGQAKADIEKGGAAAQLAKAKIATGTMFSMALLDYALNGGITGSGSPNKSLRESRLRDQVLPNSIRIGDLTLQLNRFDPGIGYPALVAGNIAEMLRGKEIDEGDSSGITDILAAFALASGQGVIDKAALSGIGRLMETIQNQNLDSYAAADFLAKEVTGLVPASSAFRAVEEAWSPEVQDPSGVWQNVIAMVAGLSDSLPTKRDAYGFTISADEVGHPFVGSFNQISPARVSHPLDNVLELEIQENGVPFTKLRKDQSFIDPTTGVTVDIDMHDKGLAFEALAALAGHMPTIRSSVLLPGGLRPSGTEVPEEIGLFDAHRFVVRSPNYAKQNAIPETGGRSRLLQMYVGAFRKRADDLILREPLDQFRERMSHEIPEERLDAMVEQVFELRRQVSQQGARMRQQVIDEHGNPPPVPTPSRLQNSPRLRSR